MQIHTFLDEDKLTNIVMFRDENDKIVGMITYDTCYDDRVYLLHTTSDKTLLNKMVDIVIENESSEVIIKVNSKDEVLVEVLQERQFKRTKRDNTVLGLDLSARQKYTVG